MLGTLATAIALLALAAPAAQAAAPAFDIVSSATPTRFPAGDETGTSGYMIVVTNTGAAPTGGPIAVTDQLPVGLSVDLTPDGLSG